MMAKRRALVRQRGVAVVTALLLTTLSITIVASLFWQQQVQVRSIENQRLQLQKQWILRGAMDWAALILRADANTSAGADHLGEPWAVPLAETRLDQYVEGGRAEGDAAEATLSGSIVDAMSRLNLTNLAKEGLVQPKDENAFAQLLTSLQLNPALAKSAAQAIAATQAKALDSAAVPSAAAAAPRVLGFYYVDDLLAVPGFTPEIVAKLREYVIFLPPNITQINVNTAPAEVLAAKIDTLTLAGAKQLIERRKTAHFRNAMADFLPALQTVVGGEGGQNLPDVNVDVWTESQYFLVNGRVRMNRAGLEVQALMHRQQQATPRVVWIREH